MWCCCLQCELLFDSVTNHHIVDEFEEMALTRSSLGWAAIVFSRLTNHHFVGDVYRDDIDVVTLGWATIGFVRVLCHQMFYLESLLLIIFLFMFWGVKLVSVYYLLCSWWFIYLPYSYPYILLHICLALVLLPHLTARHGVRPPDTSERCW